MPLPTVSGWDRSQAQPVSEYFSRKKGGQGGDSRGVAAWGSPVGASEERGAWRLTSLGPFALVGAGCQKRQLEIQLHLWKKTRALQNDFI